MTDDAWLRTGIGASTPDSITIRGRDLAAELMGRLTFTELAFLLVSGREPTPEQTRLLDCVLVALADHGLTPTVLAARLTYTGAPESLQGAVAAGLLGGGTVLLGVVEDSAAYLASIRAQADGDLAAAAAAAVRATLAAGQRVPGLGHPIHRVEDPRTPRIYAVAAANALEGEHLRLMQLVAAAHAEQTGKQLPINGAGVCGAALADLGFDSRIIRGFALIARTAGLVAQLAEEMDQPTGMRLWHDVERRATYDP